jgi:septum formation protein
MKSIILASASPRRKELLQQIGIKFEVEPSKCHEDLIFGMKPHVFAREMSLKKARFVAGRHKNSVVIAADTIIVIDGQILGKPHTEQEALKILELINGKCHSVLTGFSLIDSDSNITVSNSVETKVYFKQLTLPEMEAYVGTGESLDKAGAYAIQGLGAVMVEKIEGDYFNVMGLPLCTITEALKEFGIKVL